MKVLIAVQDESIVQDVLSFLHQRSWIETAEIKVLHVVETPYLGYHADLDLQQRIRCRAQEMVASLVAQIEKTLPAAKIEGLVLEGDPKEEILLLAQSMNSDLIVMGSHGRGALGRFFLGSVSLAVHAASPCSILILRPSKKHELLREESKNNVMLVSTGGST